MTISIIIPYKNAKKWLNRCVNSLKQQKGDFEFIFINDGDDIEPEGDDRILVYRNEHEPGVSGARNTGIDLAIGDYITFLDVDDELLPNAYETYQEILKTPAELYQLNHLRYYTQINKEVLKYDNPGGRYTIDNLPLMWFGVWNKLFKRELIQNIRYKEGMQYGEDGLFIFECMTKTDHIQHADRQLVTVRHRFDNKQSLSHTKKIEDIIKQTRAYEEFMMRQSDIKIRRAVCKELGKLWSSSVYEKVVTDIKK